MLIELLDKAVVPVLLAIIAAGGIGAVRVSRKTEAPVPAGPPPTMAQVPAPATPPGPDADDQVVRSYLLGEVARFAVAEAASTGKLLEQDQQLGLQGQQIADLGARYDRLAADYTLVRDGAIVLVRWRDAGAPHPPPIVSDTVRRLLGLLHLPETQETRP